MMWQSEQHWCKGLAHKCLYKTGRMHTWVQAIASCRYEDEEDLDVCEAMERVAQLFLSDSGSVEDVTEEDIDQHKQ